MKTRILAATALIISGFTPVALPMMVSAASAQDASQCTDTSILGPARNRHSFGTPVIISDGEPTVDTSAPNRSGSSGNVFVTVTTTTPPLVQRCVVVNSQGNLTDKYYDVTISEGSETTEDVRICANKNSAPTGTEVTADGITLGFSQADCDGFVS